MVNVFDVASYILQSMGTVSTLKLQKLCYYAYVRFLVENRKAMFKEGFEAWANGPVCRELFNFHKGRFFLDKNSIPNSRLSGYLSEKHMSTITTILEEYGYRSADDLISLTHRELPWKEARGDAPDGFYCNKKISQRSILAFYSNDRA